MYVKTIKVECTNMKYSHLLPDRYSKVKTQYILKESRFSNMTKILNFANKMGNPPLSTGQDIETRKKYIVLLVEFCHSIFPVAELGGGSYVVSLTPHLLALGQDLLDLLGPHTHLFLTLLHIVTVTG